MFEAYQIGCRSCHRSMSVAPEAMDRHAPAILSWRCWGCERREVAAVGAFALGVVELFEANEASTIRLLWPTFRDDVEAAADGDTSTWMSDTSNWIDYPMTIEGIRCSCAVCERTLHVFPVSVDYLRPAAASACGRWCDHCNTKPSVFALGRLHRAIHGYNQAAVALFEAGLNGTPIGGAHLPGSPDDRRRR